MKHLTLFYTEKNDELARPPRSHEITADSPAMEIFTDFSEHKPLVIDSSTSAVEAETLMHKTHLKLIVVVDESEHFLGIVSLDDLNSQSFIRKLSEGYQRSDLLVTDFMKPKSQLKAFDYSELFTAKIHDIIDAQKSSGEQLCLVIDREMHQIRGIFSSNEIAKRLDIPVKIEKTPTFAHIFKAIGH